MKIAVLGSGISGLSSAYFLQARHEVTVFEREPRIGGHTYTVMVPTAQGDQPVDIGFIVLNERNYPNLLALFGELGIQTRPTRMSFSLSIGDGAYEWHGSANPLTVFAQPSNLFRLSHLRMLAEIFRLNRRCRSLLAAQRLPTGSLGQFLDTEGFSSALASRYLLPMAGMIWSCSPLQAADYPAADFMRFFDSHGLFTATQQPQWYSVVGGSQRYLTVLRERFNGRIRSGEPVLRVERGVQGVWVSTSAGSERYDAVVSAVHADEALAMLVGASAAERQMLAGIPYTRSRVVLHTDVSFLPRRRAAWASWNYRHPVDEVHDQPISGSYWMNQLQAIAGPTQYVVTLNPQREVPADRVLHDIHFSHPHYRASSSDTHRLLPALQGSAGLWWCGAWCGYGFHEDGLKSALDVVEGLDYDCLPAWARHGRPQPGERFQARAHSAAA